MTLIPDTRRGVLVRSAIAAVIVIVFTATTTAVAGLLQFKQLATDIGGTPAIPDAQVAIPNPGNPQTILIIGSDHRAGTPFSKANTDTMILVRLDASSSTINVISIPRDLEVQIPHLGGSYTARLNSAYSVGGPGLLMRVLQRQVFHGLKVNHLVDVNFGSFQALVNALGCVYTDVDHRYYNDTRLTDYSSIDIQPGYQRLCGTDPIRGALAFVRFRHTDSDIVRSARQQDFIRWAKDQYGVSNLISNRDSLLKIFGRYTQTDSNLRSVDGLINLFNLVAFSAGHTIKQVRFPAILPSPTFTPPVANRFTPQSPSYVTADPAAEQRRFDEFMTPTTAAPRVPSAVPAGAAPAAGAGSAPRRSVPSASAPALTADAGEGRSQVVSLGQIGMAVYFPRRIATGSSYCSSPMRNCPVEIPSPGSYPRGYTIHDQGGNPHTAYRMTLVKNAALGQYYAVQGMTWRTPPILANPNQTRTVGGKRLMLYLNGHHLTLVAWRAPPGVYWISNTLTDDLTNQEMLGIAASLTRGRT
ncbi:MAG: LCP family protein [Solirubrobacteraceae bacterium]